MQVQRRIEALVLSESYTKQSDFIPLAEMSPHLAHAAIAAEDSRFFDHGGYGSGGSGKQEHIFK